MPGVDFAVVRSRVSMSQVLAFLGWVAQYRSGDDLRGPCPVHGSVSKRSRSFSANVVKNSFQCFRCGAKGNQLDLWADVKHMSLYQAALDLCDRAGVEVPWICRW